MFAKQKIRISYVYKTKQNKRVTDKLYLQNKQMFTKQKCTDKLCLQNKTKVYKHVMFIKQNKRLQTRYVYKTKYKTKVYKQVMFIKQN